jgi:hypothetical protein
MKDLNLIAIKLMLIVLHTISLINPAFAQTKKHHKHYDLVMQVKPKLTGDIKADLGNLTGTKITGSPISDLIGALDVKLLPDLMYAKALADASTSKVTGPCWGAWIDVINTRQKAVKGADGVDMDYPNPSLITNFEKLVEIRNMLQPDSDFMIKCSPVASMVRKDIAGFMGLVISGGAGLATLVPGF